MANEKRLIDMEDALRRMENAEHLMHSINGIKAVDIGALRQFFGMLKPVDAVEVVRCKDCKYAMDMMPIENSGGCLMGECTLRKEDDIVFTAWGDEFCSYGERKDNGKTD